MKMFRCKRKIAALCAAVMALSMCMTACGGGDEEETTEQPIEIITDGQVVVTSVPVSSDGTDSASSTKETTEFKDPAQLLGIDTDADEGSDPAQTEQTSSVTTINQQEINDMISNAVTSPVAEKTPVIADYNVDCTTRYGYNQLNDAEKALYKDILQAATSIRLKVETDESVTDEMWVKVYGCVYTQEPQLFWLSSKKVSKGKLWYWEVDRDIIADMQAEIDAKVTTLLSQAQGKSDFEKLELFHDWIVLNNQFVKEDGGYNQTIYGGFVNGVIQCEGYAKTMQYLCDLSGIESMVVVGSNEADSSHAWNIVKVDGQWYNLDCTWDDPILENPVANNLRHRYFLVPDSWIHEKTHFNINKKITGTSVKFFDPPSCTSDAMNYFNVKDMLYSDKQSADAALKASLKETAAAGLRVAEIRVTDKTVYDAVTANLKEYASYIKGENSAVTAVASNCDPNTLVIELDLTY